MEAGQERQYTEYEARIVQDERNRIAKVIHDGVAQDLALLMLKMEVISRLADIDQARMKAELLKATEILEATVQELREAVASLKTASTEQSYLIRSARALANSFSERAASAVNPDSEGSGSGGGETAPDSASTGSRPPGD